VGTIEENRVITEIKAMKQVRKNEADFFVPDLKMIGKSILKPMML